MATPKKVISVSASCRNEEGNLQEWYDRTIKTLEKFPQYDYEFVVTDNYSTDNSRTILRRLAAQDRKFKVIFNSNDFGPVRSPCHALLESTGDAVIMIPTDLQEAPELIADMIEKWEQGYQVVAGVKSGSKELPLMYLIRKLYYRLLDRASDSHAIIHNFTGFGLYDRKFTDAMRKLKDPYPFFRGLVTEIGFKRTEIKYVQEKRKHGVSKHKLPVLFDIAMLGFINQSRLPLRLATISGFCLGSISLLISLGYLIYKLLYWQTFTLGLAPLVIGLFFFSAMQLIFIGIVGEYIGVILTKVKNYPLVIEEERLNFDSQPAEK
jgi:polyisoprenyl-phosphate glycosyltransferase